MAKTSLKFLILFGIFGMLIFVSPAFADREFDPNFILSDYDLTNITTMTQADIQSFLEFQGGAIADMTFLDPATETMKPASQIIYEKAIENTINPQYLLVLLQKEQSLVRDPNPTQKQLDWACGFGVCDSCSMDDPRIQKYKGFFNQIDYAAGNTRWYIDNPDRLVYKVGQTYTIDGEEVTISNLATRAMYTYTPHIHGNYNLWRLWNEWFL